MKVEIVALPQGTPYPYEQKMTLMFILFFLLAGQYVVTTYAVTMRIRTRVFNSDFMQKFKEEHEKAFPGKQPPTHGYPDTGCGRYGKALSYKDWYDMNNGQRCQQNFLEQITFILGISLVAALQPDCTWAAFGILAAYVIGRFVFTLGYSRFGP